ncbi:MAG: TPM domain-containing protein [Bacteroidota bacterium]
MKRFIFLFILFCYCQLSIKAQFFQPAKLTYTVTDFTSYTLTKEDINILSNEVERINESTGNQIAIVVMATSAGETLESFSLRMANQWGIGSKKKSNGVLILVLAKDRKMRIEVGKGLTNVISNQEAERIIAQHMAPEFKLNNYRSGLMKGLKDLEAVMIENADAAENKYAKYVILWLFLPWYLFIELLKRLLKYKWLVKMLGFIGYLLIGSLAVNIGVSIGFAFILFLISFLLFKFPKYRWLFKKTQSANNRSAKLVYSIGILGISMVSVPYDNYYLGSSSGGSGNYSGGGSYGGGSGGSFGGGGGSFGGDGGSGSW